MIFLIGVNNVWVGPTPNGKSPKFCAFLTLPLKKSKKRGDQIWYLFAWPPYCQATMIGGYWWPGEICRYMHCYFFFPMKINALLFSFLLPRFMPLFSLQIIFYKESVYTWGQKTIFAQGHFHLPFPRSRFGHFQCPKQKSKTTSEYKDTPN